MNECQCIDRWRNQDGEEMGLSINLWALWGCGIGNWEAVLDPLDHNIDGLELSEKRRRNLKICCCHHDTTTHPLDAP